MYKRQLKAAALTRSQLGRVNLITIGLIGKKTRRLERAKLAVHEYRRRMLELYARDEAQDDDGK